MKQKHRMISATQTRKDLGDVFGEANYHKEEDAEDIHEAKLALKEIQEKGSISFEEMKKRMG